MDANTYDTSGTSTPRPAKTQSEKTAEFARLFYFFEKLTQPRATDTPPAACPADDATDAWVPKDIAPLLKNLSAILTKDAPEDSDERVVDIPTTPMRSTFDIPPPSTTSPQFLQVPSTPNRGARRNTLATPPRAPGSAPTAAQRARFPLGEKRYPFTFKMLLHKLYDLEGWAEKVRDVLATSQEQYRSLEAAECTHSSPGSPGSIFSAPPAEPESPSPRSAKHGRTGSASDKSSRAKEFAHLGLGTPPQAPAGRAIKKRIVNRRRSVSISVPGVAKPEGWIYDAAVSSVDTESQRKGLEERRRKRVFSSAGFEEKERPMVGLSALVHAGAFNPPVKRDARVHFDEGRARKRSHTEH